MNELALFAGAGGGILGGKLLGWRTVCAVEWEPYPASVLAQRQNDRLLPPFPIWDDVRTFDGRPWAGRVDVVSGGFPCQDISVAGKGAGITGERSGMWTQMARIIGEVRPRFVFVENSPALLTRGLGTVLGDLAALGYDCRWTVLGAANVGANHQRDRFWLVANTPGEQYKGAPHEEQWEGGTKLSSDSSFQRHGDSETSICSRRDSSKPCGEDVENSWSVCSGAKINGREVDGPEAIGPSSGFGRPSWWELEPALGRVAYGVAARVDRLRAVGNGQVPLCAATAFNLLSKISL